MKISTSFPGQVALTLAAITAAGFYPMSVYASGEVIRAAVAGAVMATCNVLAGYASIRYATGKPMGTFMKFVLGGMGIRLMVLTAALLVLVRYMAFHGVALVASLGVFYVAFLALEILFIQKHLNIRQSN